MKITIKVEKQVDIKTLHVHAKVRYWEDTEINGVLDSEDGEDIPCKINDYWCPIIDIDTGLIINWNKGINAKIHYKVCDAGSYYLKDENGNTVLSVENDYVPKIMCPAASGYGDYIIMKIDESGKIQNWNPEFDEFINED